MIPPATTTPRDASEWIEASYTPDLPSELDATGDMLVEALASSVRAWPGDLPRTRAQFENAVLSIFASGLEDTDRESLGSVLREMIQAQIARERAEAMLWVVALVMDSSNPAFVADCLAFATGLHSIQGGVTQTAIAEKYGLGRSAVSARVNLISELLGLHPSRGMRSPEAKLVYANRAYRVHKTAPDKAKKEVKRSRSVVSDILRIAHWYTNRGNLALLNKENQDVLKRAFRMLQPICAAVATL